MALLTTIDGVPLFSTVEEALAYAQQNGLVGYHVHTHQGQIGYMGGATHGAASSSSAGFQEEIPTPNTSVSNTGSSGGGY